MSLRIARALLVLAARRWPTRVRADVEREWLAELQVLAAQRRHARMLAFAVSLAAARPPERPPLVATTLPAVWHAARLVVVAPLIALALLFANLLMMNGIVASLPWDWSMSLQLPLLTAFAIVSAVLVAGLGRRWTLPGARLPLLLAVIVPGFAVVAWVRYLTGGPDRLERHLSGYLVFFFGLAVVLLAVHRLAAAGHTRGAWWIGVLGATVVADVAVMLPLLGLDGPPGEVPHPAYAPVWLFTAVTDSGFGLPHPTGTEMFVIGHVTEFDPLLFIVYAALALGAVVSAASGSPVRPPAGGKFMRPRQGQRPVGSAADPTGARGGDQPC